MRFWKQAVAIACLLTVLPLLFAGAAVQPLLSGQRIAQIPFQTGEELIYEVNWKPVFFFPAFKAGELSLTIRDFEYQDKPAYQISARAVSEGLLSKVAGIEVRDYFESTVDRLNFRSYRMLTQTRQNSRREDLEVIFDYAGNRTLIREIKLSEDAPKETRREVIPGIPGPLVDVLSVFYAARLRNHSPNDRFHLFLSNRGKIEKVEVIAERRETVKTDIGAFETVKLTTVGGLFSGGGEFRIWYSRDASRVPVKFEADVKVGKVYGKIVKLNTPRMLRGVIKTG